MRSARSPSRCESEATGRGWPASGPPSRSGGRDGRGHVWPRGGLPSTSRLCGRTMKQGRSRDPSWGTAFGRRFGASINSRLLPRRPQLRISRLRSSFTLVGRVPVFFLDYLQAFDLLEGEAHYAALLALVLEVQRFIVVVDEHLGEDSLVVIESLSPLWDSLALYLALLLTAHLPRYLTHLLARLTHLYTSPFFPSNMLPKSSSIYPRGDSKLYSPECVE